MRQAVERDPRKGGAIPSTKGLLGSGSLDASLTGEDHPDSDSLG